ncbi:MAG: hypothetical protein ABIU20_07090 [Blastocatellia bacterium]
MNLVVDQQFDNKSIETGKAVEVECESQCNSKCFLGERTKFNGGIPK